MIHKILEEKIGIDEILVVTFTNAAASEMRERILEAIYQKMEEEPESKELQKQVTLLNKASICTIHSFCLEVIRNHFYEIDASANFRIADTAEIDLLKQETIEEIFEENYEKENAAFFSLLEMYTGYREDTPLKEQILKIYSFIQSMPFPQKWLSEKIEELCIPTNQDFARTTWGKLLIAYAKEQINVGITILKNLLYSMMRFSELEKFRICIQQDIDNYEMLISHMNSWDDACSYAQVFSWGKWPIDRKVDLDLKEEAKEVRDQVKKKVKKIIDQTIGNPSQEISEDILAMYEPMKQLKDLLFEFMTRFAEKKKERNIIDFHDIEHFALEILLQEDEKGLYPSPVAKKYQEKFKEVAIDEYQDSNLVQEYILKSVSKGNNQFMVGDVKQSIYKFRQARPELFLEKYETYGLIDEKENGRKIQLFKNFRSRKNILDMTNLVFEKMMSKQLGDIEYNEEEYLNLGAGYLEKEQVDSEDFEDGILPEDFEIEGKTEVYLIDPTEEKWNQWEDAEKDEPEEKIEDVVLEAKFVAKKVEELIHSNQYIWDKKKKKFRKVMYRDIAILLRSTSDRAPIFEKELEEREIPVFSDTGTQFLDSIEIQTILSLLKIIDNPMQDIPLVTVLRSNIGGFTDNDLVEIRCAEKLGNFYEAMQKAQIQVCKDLKEKIKSFLEKLKEWRTIQSEVSLAEFIWKLYDDTSYYQFVRLMPNGQMRQANLKILFEKAKQYESASLKGLYQFIRFIERLHQNSGDFGSAKMIGENENVVRIMSIHKSKGLEFPIVILSGTGKKFNLQDTTEPILFHHAYGFGVNYKNSELKLEYQTLAKEAIKKVMEQETISEEMRILYVALTRAKEHLIITGIAKEAQKQLQEKEKELELYQGKESNSKINSSLCKKYRTYLDWIELVWLSEKEKAKERMNLEIFVQKQIKEMIVKGKEKDEIQISSFDEKIKKVKENNKNFAKEQKEMVEILNWKYPYEILSKIPTKTSVSLLKNIETEEDSIKPPFAIKPIDEYEEEVVKPRFLKKEEALTAAEIGTIMHLCIQKLEEKKEYTREELKVFIEQLEENGVLTVKQVKGVSLSMLEDYVKSNLFQELKQAKIVEKEKPFYLRIPVSEIYEIPEKDIREIQETILVQGVIDLYYIDKNDKLVLVDYKTDFVKDGKEQDIVNRYQKQLTIYQRALENALGRKVDKVEICLIRKGAKCILI